jgi:histidyl-tRNA synthetase
MKAVNQLRKAGIKAELYPDAAKLGKQFQHADKRGIDYTVLAGEEEMQSATFKIKTLASGDQQQVTIEELENILK